MLNKTLDPASFTKQLEEGFFNKPVQQSRISKEEMDRARATAETADRHTPAVNEILVILNRIINNQTKNNESWNVMIDVLRKFSPEVRTYIYKQSMEE